MALVKTSKITLGTTKVPAVSERQTASASSKPTLRNRTAPEAKTATLQSGSQRRLNNSQAESLIPLRRLRVASFNGPDRKRSRRGRGASQEQLAAIKQMLINLELPAEEPVRPSPNRSRPTGPDRNRTFNHQFCASDRTQCRSADCIDGRHRGAGTSRCRNR